MLADRVRMGTVKDDGILVAGDIVNYKITSLKTSSVTADTKVRDVKVKSEGTTNSTDYVEFTEDINVKKDDSIQFYVYTSYAPHPVKTQLFQISLNKLVSNNMFETILLEVVICYK